MKFYKALLCLTLISVPVVWAGPSARIERHKPCNLFPMDQPVVLKASTNGLPTGTGQARAVLTPYFGEPVVRAFPVEIDGKGKGSFDLDFGILQPGYYELELSVTGSGSDPAKAEKMSLGVAKVINRTAAEAGAQHSRFGLKMFYLDKDHENPWMKEEFDEREIVSGFTGLGMQWTRADMHLKARLPTLDLARDFPVNIVLKIEGFPDYCYDTERYGPREKRKDWNKATVPLKEPYQKWLAEDVAAIPAEQNVFEIGNEVWGGKMPPEEFAELCRLIIPVVKKARPDSIILVDIGVQDFLHRFIAAKGLDGVDALAKHPYSFTPLPEHRTRVQLRNFQDLVKSLTGREFDIYITEYGWPVAPKDRRGHSVTETQQAQRTTRQSLMLYAEGMKVLIPHWMGDRERDITDREHWFGFFRPNHQPRPVVLAHATCAEMIDGGRFVGDLWYGPGIGAMLFEKDGKFIQALWTAEVDKTAEVQTGVEEVMLVNLVGSRRTVASPGGKLSLPLSGNVTYLVGVNPKLAEKAAPPTQELNPELWSERTGGLTMTAMKTQPVIDGSLADWSGVKTVDLTAEKSVANLGAKASWAWDKKHVYAAVEVQDPQMGKGEVFECNLGARPARQLDLGNMGIYDYTFSIQPAADLAKSKLVVTNKIWPKSIEAAVGQDSSGLRWAIKPKQGGWTAEIAIPIKLLTGFPTPKPGAKVSTQFQLRKENKVRLAYGETKTRLWPYLELAE